MNCLAVAVIAAFSIADAQRMAPTRAREIPSDEGVVQGRVVDARTNRPVANASVDLQGLEGAVNVSTDAQGRYEIAAVVPGEYRMSARAPGYVPSQFGQRHAS